MSARLVACAIPDNAIRTAHWSAKMLDTLEVNFHGKRHTDFDLKRIIKAQEQGFDVPVTAYLAERFRKARTASRTNYEASIRCVSL